MNYPHMCRMDHDEIGYRGDGERCPVCIATDDLAARDREPAEACKLLKPFADRLAYPAIVNYPGIAAFLARHAPANKETK